MDDRNEYMREYLRKNKAKINKQRRAKYQERKSEIRKRSNEANARYYEKSKDKILANAKKKNWYYDKKKRVEIRKQYYMKHPSRISIASANTRAKKAGLPFNLTVEWFDEQFVKGCAVTGIQLDANGSKTPWTVHVDRIIPKNGYIKDNCRLVCACYNIAKKHWDDDVVIKMAKALLSHNNLAI